MGLLTKTERDLAETWRAARVERLIDGYSNRLGITRVQAVADSPWIRQCSIRPMESFLWGTQSCLTYLVEHGGYEDKEAYRVSLLGRASKMRKENGTEGVDDTPYFCAECTSRGFMPSVRVLGLCTFCDTIEG